jgi:hypothetical protein
MAGDGGDEEAGEDGESHAERVNRELIELLNEIRVALPGVQVLFAFLLTAPFATGWKEVSELQEDAYIAALLTAGLATICLIAPTTFHRINFRTGEKEPILHVSNILVLVGTFMLAVSMTLSIFLVCDLVLDRSAAVLISGVSGIAFLALWFAFPLVMRGRNPPVGR